MCDMAQSDTLQDQHFTAVDNQAWRLQFLSAEALQRP